MNLKIPIILLFFIIIYADEKSSVEIQQEINSRNTQLELLKRDILKVEESIIEKTKNEINNADIIMLLAENSKDFDDFKKLFLVGF